jgi:hypothetical protein
MKRFEKLSDREQGRKLGELEQYTIRLVGDEFSFTVWSKGNSKLTASTINRGVPPNSSDSIR